MYHFHWVMTSENFPRTSHNNIMAEIEGSVQVTLPNICLHMNMTLVNMSVNKSLAIVIWFGYVPRPNPSFVNTLIDNFNFVDIVILLNGIHM